ncbi:MULTISPECIES: hypothetical protein [unclassified Cupriavidus]|uniref:hypothetical protein n=1 Tax=unclassified Cupriavidus TaxID=2640874 RepID=UPI0012EC8494|nr:MULTISPECIES: hypothetical protein [unclassified Cupriavidus]MBP0633992.1 hypothetical protein [Cupriavidus sp. AcVe19-6a]
MENRLAVRRAPAQADITMTHDHDTGQEIPQDGVTTSWIKKVLRPVARFGFRLAKPLLRPIASRMGSYLLDGVHQNILHEIRHASTITAQEGRATRGVARIVWEVTAGDSQSIGFHAPGITCTARTAHAVPASLSAAI